VSWSPRKWSRLAPRLEGDLWAADRARGRWRSSAVYSILADEWDEVERALAARVAASVT
jgi:RimJ/RimL family protein N-acetyltransferase